MMFKRFPFSLRMVILILSLFSSTEAASEEKDAIGLLKPLTQRFANLKIDLRMEEVGELQSVAQQLQKDLPEETIKTLVGVAGQYLDNTKVLPLYGNEEGTRPSFPQVLTILRLLAEMEKSNLNHPRIASRFSYDSLAHYFSVCTFEDQQYYLGLFHNLLVASQFDEILTHQMIDYACLFMRYSHTPEKCTLIAAAVRDYMLTHPYEDYKEGPLRDAETDQLTWSDEEILDQLHRYLSDVYTDNESTEGDLQKTISLRFTVL